MSKVKVDIKKFNNRSEQRVLKPILPGIIEGDGNHYIEIRPVELLDSLSLFWDNVEVTLISYTENEDQQMLLTLNNGTILAVSRVNKVKVMQLENEEVIFSLTPLPDEAFVMQNFYEADLGMGDISVLLFADKESSIILNQIEGE